MDFLPRVAGVTPTGTTKNTRAGRFLPRVAGVTLQRDRTEVMNRTFFPALRGVTPSVAPIILNDATFFPALRGGLLFVYYSAFSPAQLSSPHGGGYSRDLDNNVSSWYFLPRIAGVTLMKVRRLLCIDRAFFPA